MEKPKIVSMKEALESPENEGAVPPLPGLPRVEPPVEESEIPPERVAPVLPPSLPVASAVSSPVSTPLAAEPLPSSPVSVSSPSPAEASSEPHDASSSESAVPSQPPSGAPPWVERAGPVPSYPGVGRPKIQSVSAGNPQPAAAQPVAPSRSEADAFAEEMATAPAASPAQNVAQEYRQAALPPVAPARLLTPEEERVRAKSLAAEIHAKNQSEGFFGKFKRMLGVR